jgi:glycosyltransferase involved in cell wall biosynthesis
MPMSNHLVSTIIPVYNRPEMVRRAVQSVLDQTYRPIEIILVDDGSTDNTPDVLLELKAANPFEIELIFQSNSGAGLAREAGRQVAQGEYIQYLDSDDYLLPNKFSDQVSALAVNPQCDIAYGTSRLEDASGNIIDVASRHTGKNIPFLFPLLLVERWWHTHTPLFRRCISDAAGPWPEFRPEDWDLEARMGSLRARLVHCGTTVSVQVEHDSPNRVTRGAFNAYLHNEAEFLPRLHACAILAGVLNTSPEMSIFSRWCFLRARQLDLIGDFSKATSLLSLAFYSGSADLFASSAWQQPLYRIVRRLMGGRLSGALAALHHPRSPHVFHDLYNE